MRKKQKKQNKMLKTMFIMCMFVLLVIIMFFGYGKWQANKDVKSFENFDTEQDTITIKDVNSFENFDTEQNTITMQTQLKNAQTILEDMTLKEKIGQLFIIRPESLVESLTADQVHSTNSYGVIEWTEEMATILEEYPAGGIALFSKNIKTPSQIISFIEDMQNDSEISLFISVDEEGGLVSRIANDSDFDVTTYDSMQTIGDTGNTDEAYNVGFTIGSYLYDYGFNLDFAPVTDINTNSDNIIIGNRAFGSNPKLVASMAYAEIKGLHDAGVMSSIKHFPGHGDTTDDTHSGYVAIEKNWDELLTCELIPFIETFEITDMVMVAHITANNITNDGLPSSLSYEMITNKLRGELGYDNVVITDSLAMGAIIQNYTSAESALMAIQAGVDIMLMPNDYVEAFEAIYQAVSDGTILESRIDESVLRILELKIKYGLIE